jgi:hypothetical protein
MSGILKKINLYLEQKYDNPEFYKKNKPKAKAIIEKLMAHNWSKTKKMRREAIECLRGLAECDEKAAHKLWEAIYTTAVDQGKVVMEMIDGDKKEPIPEGDELNESVSAGQKYRNKQGSIIMIGEVKDNEAEIISKDKDAPATMVVTEIENQVKAGALTLITN